MEFESTLKDMYNELKDQGKPFEVITLPLDDENSFGDIPWLAVPFKDKVIEKLTRYFELNTLPTLVLIGVDGKTLNSNAAELVEEHGTDAYPFSRAKLEQLAEIERERDVSQTLESLLVSGDLDYVIGKDESKVKPP